jgi:LmbE family N-acetylglucosaminyl deacetylase
MNTRRLGGSVLRRARAVAAGLRNRRFQTGLVHDPAAPAIVLSPHHDDAVINCWSLLTADEDLLVVNVFAGVPRGVAASAWDRLCGAHDSEALMRERITEDRAALRIAGHSPVNLPFLGRSYRKRQAPPTFAAIEAAVRPSAGRLSALYAPVAVTHVDHRHIRRFAEAVGRSGIPVRLYADAPYATRAGWPAWVTGRPKHPRLDIDRAWEESPVFPDVRYARPVALTPEATAAKLTAMQAYETQFVALDGGPLALLSNPEVHAFEVFWELPPN